MATLANYIEEFSNLHIERHKGFRAPHKAIMLLTVIDAIDEDEICSPRIPLTDELNDRFNSLWRRYLGTSAVYMPDISKPYFHMQHESFWRLVDKTEAKRTKTAETILWQDNDEKKELPTGGYSIKSMQRAFAYAEIKEDLFYFLLHPDARAVLRVILIEKYLTNQPTRTIDLKDFYKETEHALPLINNEVEQKVSYNKQKSDYSQKLQAPKNSKLVEKENNNLIQANRPSIVRNYILEVEQTKVHEEKLNVKTGQKKAIISAMERFNKPVGLSDIVPSIKIAYWGKRILEKDVENVLHSMSEVICTGPGKYILKSKIKSVIVASKDRYH